MEVTPRSAAVAGSATLALAARAKALAAEGRDVVNMAVGEPDFPAPAIARESAATLLATGEIRYTPAAGTPQLRARLAQHMVQTRGGDWAPEQVVVTHSCKHALSSTLAVLCREGQRVVLFEPVWSSYEAAIQIAGAEAVRVAPRADLGPDLIALAALLSDSQAASDIAGMMICSPSNPSGYVWTRAETETLVALAEAHDLWILSDEIYRRLVYEGEPAVSPASVSDEGRARTIIVDGASKVFAMTGFRIGFAAGPENVIGTIGRVQSETTGCPNALSQAAYAAALVEEPPEVDAMVREFDARRRHLVAGLEAIGLSTPFPRGAFYAFSCIGDFPGGSTAFCEQLLEQEAVAIVPGKIFGMDSYVRFSYAVSVERIDAALERVGRFLAQAR
jgi:aspartate aminotransferase